MTEMPQDNISGKNEQSIDRKTFHNKEIILSLLTRAAEDQKFLARLAEDPYTVLLEYNLNQEERSALASGDVVKLELWVGRLDNRMKTWMNVRKTQNKW